MALFDLSLPELQGYLPDRQEPADFDAFWTSTLARSRARARTPRWIDVDAGYTELITQDVEFDGFDGQPIKGWFIAPRHRRGPLPVVVSYLGYGGGRGPIGSWSQMPAAGLAQFVMDSRGQGSGYRPGTTPDGAFTGPASGGVMTLGIERPDDYYYRRLLTDAVLAVDAVRQHPLVDPVAVLVQGGSQGGGIALAASALADGLLGAAIDVPFLCGFRRAVELVDTLPYGEIGRYLKIHRGAEERTFRTLSYFDGINFAARATTPAIFSVGLMDQVCPPSTVYAAYNHYAGRKRIEVYPFNGHENGEEVQAERVVAFLRECADL